MTRLGVCLQKRLDRMTEVGLAVPEAGEGFTETSSAATYSRASSVVEEVLPEGSSPTHRTHLATRWVGRRAMNY